MTSKCGKDFITGNTNIKEVSGKVICISSGSDLNMHIKDGTSVDLYYTILCYLETVRWHKTLS